MWLYTRPLLRRNAVGVPNAKKHSGAIAQLGERFNGIEEVVGSIPSGSTKTKFQFEPMKTVAPVRENRARESLRKSLRTALDAATSPLLA